MEEIFKKCRFNYDKLLNYGFKLKDNKYIYKQKIMDNSFEIILEVTDKIIGKIFDLEYGEEYTSFRIKNQNNEFALKVKNEFNNILKDIKEKCTTEEYFITNQANIVARLITEKYKVKPEFLFKNKDDAIFRASNGKWFAVLLKININKLTNKNYDVEIINLKLDKDKIPIYLKQKGIYKAYHMNKKYWVSIVLDNTLSDTDIMSYVSESYNIVKK